MTASAVPSFACAPGYADFLRQQVARQSASMASYPLNGEQVWLKKARPRPSLWRHHLLGALAAMARLPVLRPVPNPGGAAAIATEARRLRDLAGRGLRVPSVLALQPEGLLLRHLGVPGQPTPSLAQEMQDALPAGSAAVLALWAQGLQALRHVHATGTSLSQALACNLLRCPDGVLGYIDFEDDPTRVLPLVHCQARDALCYVHSTALLLQHSGAMDEARTVWAGWLVQCSPGLQTTLIDTSARLAWLRHLPTSHRLGRDVQCARAAYAVLARR